MNSRQPNEPEHLFDALADLVERLIGFLVQLVADVLGNGQRVEQRAFLKDHADVGAHFHHLIFGVVVDELPVHPDLPGIRLQQAENQLQRDRFARAARAEDDLRVAAPELEADIAQHDRVVERQRHMVEDDDRIVRSGLRRFGHGGSCLERVHHSIKQRNHQPRDEEIQHEHRHRRRDHGVGRRASDALRAACGPQPDVAADADDREPEKERLREPHPDVLHVEAVGNRLPVDARRHLQLLDGDDAAAQNAHRMRKSCARRSREPASRGSRTPGTGSWRRSPSRWRSS